MHVRMIQAMSSGSQLTDVSECACVCCVCSVQQAGLVNLLPRSLSNEQLEQVNRY